MLTLSLSLAQGRAAAPLAKQAAQNCERNRLNRLCSATLLYHLDRAQVSLESAAQNIHPHTHSGYPCSAG